VTDIAEQLLAAIAIRENAAKACAGAPWIAGEMPRSVHVEAERTREHRAWAQLGYVASTTHEEGATHIALNDPGSILRLCQAHREIVGHWQATRDALSAAEGTILAGACRVRLGAYDNVLRALASAYGIEEAT
jgi:hypothetical protein